jgi:hypothetical protein
MTYCPPLFFTAPSHIFSSLTIPLVPRYPPDMGIEHVEETADGCCPTCNSMGYLYTREHDEVCRPSLTVLRDRSFEGFCTSAKRGCSFCGVILQAFPLLQFVATGMRVELLLYADSPVELHSSGQKDVHEVVEIYPCPSRCPCS